MHISMFTKILQIGKIHEIYKGKLGGQVLKRPPFGIRCTDFAQIFFWKSHYYNVRKVKNFLSTNLKKLAIVRQKSVGPDNGRNSIK